MDLIHTLFYFIVAIVFLVSFHEFGHFWVARKMGVKVLRFSVGFGKVLWSYQKTPESTEYALSAIPLGGYVKMVDEREGEVKKEDLPYAFNRQPLYARVAIVIAGPLCNLILAVFLYWIILMLGETGIRPIVGKIEMNTLAYQAGFVEGDEILAVNDKTVPTWSEAMGLIFASAMTSEEPISVEVENEEQQKNLRLLKIPQEISQEPKQLYAQLGLQPWIPKLKPIIGRVVENSAASRAGLKVDDLIISADKILITDWMQWVEYVQQRAEIKIALLVSRGGVHLPMTIIPKAVETEQKTVGKIGAAVKIPETLIDTLRVEYSLSVGDAFVEAVAKTTHLSLTTLKMMGRMLVGKSSVENLSGPISIAQYAGQSAERGFVHFLKFMALISVSLGVLNLLPVPMLDGGHLMFYAIEAIKGSPVSESIQIMFQQVGVLLLMSLMFLAVFLDIGRLFE